MALGGKCRKCKSKISIQYPIIELLNGAAYLGIYLFLGLSVVTIIACVLFSTLLVIFMIDLRYKIIPNGLVIVVLILGIVQTVLDKTYMNHIMGFFVMSGFLLIISIIVKGGMGMGDIKLMAAAGLLLGWQKIIVAMMVGSIVGSLIGIGLLAFKIVKRKQPIPFGPFLAIGIMLAMLFGDSIIKWYVSFIIS
jgi:leader peptidase (prepilin peptidase)/N-methyltransferase